MDTYVDSYFFNNTMGGYWHTNNKHISKFINIIEINKINIVGHGNKITKKLIIVQHALLKGNICQNSENLKFTFGHSIQILFYFCKNEKVFTTIVYTIYNYKLLTFGQG